jgi:hypothetical protein
LSAKSPSWATPFKTRQVFFSSNKTIEEIFRNN